MKAHKICKDNILLFEKQKKEKNNKNKKNKFPSSFEKIVYGKKEFSQQQQQQQQKEIPRVFERDLANTF